MKTPPGFRLVYNRLNEPFELFFDHVPYPFDANETRMIAEEAATFLSANSIVKVTLMPDEMGKLPVIRALVTDLDEDFEKPIKDLDRTELFDRTEEDSYGGIHANLDGKKSKATLIRVGGGSGLDTKSNITISPKE